MPKRTDLKSILIIGSGPIVIGQACEFDYSGTQACKVLKEEGFRVILVNSNPATIMTDPEFADATYIEPMTPEYLEAIIEKERPDAILPTMGGQTALNAALSLHRRGTLTKYNVELIGAKPEAINRAEDREEFLATMKSIGLEMPRGGFVTNTDEAMELIEMVGFPAIIRPSFTMGGSGGGIAWNMQEFREIVQHGLDASPVSRVLVEESVIGWKEYELEVMRDTADNVVIICSIENFDPMGVHTGDSITVAPAQTLSDKEYQKMRDAAIKVIRAIGVETGGSNIQFAQSPKDGRLLVIEMNPRVSRSSALASKATGFPIAKIAAKLAIGYTLDEIPNDITKMTPSCFEPVIDYIVVKIPRWDFEKFKGLEASSSQLGVQMKSVGEAMAFGRTFKEAVQKALRSLEQGRYGLGCDGKDEFDIDNMSEADKRYTMETVRERLGQRRSDMIFNIRYAMQLGMSDEAIFDATKIDPWFLNQLSQIVRMEGELKTAASGSAGLTISTDLLYRAKRAGFSDRQIAEIFHVGEEDVRAHRKAAGLIPVFKTVDTCSAEFAAETPYHYSTYEEENESIRSDKKKVVILGGGPNRIGQGIEFDYCCVHAALALEEEGIETIMINCNPETVSTDYDTCDKLYFEPLTFEDVMNVIDFEKPDGVIVTFGGQTPLKLAKQLEAAGVPILGTSPDMIDVAEDRKRFGALIDELGILCPPYGTAFETDEAIRVAERVGYPVLVRPSYVLGGRAMEICYRPEAIAEYMANARGVSPSHPILIDRFLEDAFEFDVDAVRDVDGTVIIGGIMQHIEEAGIHSGDSSSVIPPYYISDENYEQIADYTRRLATALEVVGLINVQYALKDSTVYVLEVNPRASRTVPFVSKATGRPLAKIAAKVMVGRKLKDLGVKDFEKNTPFVAIKESVFPFDKFPRVRMFLGPEMRSTGEVMGVGADFGEAILKSHLGANMKLPTEGTLFVSLRDQDKRARTVEVIHGFAELGFKVIATEGTAKFLNQHGIDAETIRKVSEGRPNIVDAIKNHEVQLVINTPSGEISRIAEYQIGWAAIEHKVPFITTLSAAASVVSAISSMRKGEHKVRSVQELHQLLAQAA